jgi:hypothetical protein
MIKQFHVWCVGAPVSTGGVFLAAFIAGALLILLLLAENRGEASAAESDQGVRQCDEDYAICRLECSGKQSCLDACLQTYNACRR